MSELKISNKSQPTCHGSRYADAHVAWRYLQREILKRNHVHKQLVMRIKQTYMYVHTFIYQYIDMSFPSFVMQIQVVFVMFDVTWTETITTSYLRRWFTQNKRSTLYDAYAIPLLAEALVVVLQSPSWFWQLPVLPRCSWRAVRYIKLHNTLFQRILYMFVDSHKIHFADVK